MSDNTIELELSPRELTGKAVKRLRKDGQVPAVIHDHGKESVLVQAPYLTLLRAYQRAGKHHPVNLVTGGRKYTALIKDAEFEPKKNQLTHVVFNAVNRNQKVEAEVPLRPRYAEGNEASPAERNGMIVLEQLTGVEVRAVPDRIPDALYYDAELLVEDGDQVTLAQVVLPDNVEFADLDVKEHPELHPVATVTTPAALEAANEAAAGEAPAEAAQEVPATEVEESAEPGTQEDEIRPGGKLQKESKSQGHDPEKK